MIIDDGEYLEALYNQIQRDKIDSQEKKITVFCLNQDVDSLCCSYMLQTLLCKQSTYFTMVPVESYAAIQEKFSREFDVESLEPRTCIFLNCGATLPIRDLVDLGSSIRAVIIDSHRPIHHSYNSDEDKMACVVIAKDDYVQKHEVPVSDEMFLEMFPELDVNSDDEDDEDADQAAKAARGDADADIASQRQGIKERQAARRREVVEYYQQGSSFGKPTSLILYQLLRQQRHENTHTLWLAICGLTDSFLHQRVDHDRYELWRLQLRDEAASQGHLDRSDDIEIEDGGLVRKPQHDATIRDVQDYRFTMYRKWTLYEGMRWTPYIAARLQTWQEKGLGNLHKLLALAGITLEEAQKQFSAMKPEQLCKLQDNLPREAHKVLLAPERFTLQSFELSLGYDSISAADHCMALTALLARSDAASLLDAFWEAHTALDLKQGVELLHSGIGLAKEMLQRIISTTGLAIQMRQVKSGRSKSLVMLNLQAMNILQPEHFQHPAVLVQAAYFLREAMLIRKSNTVPCVVVGPADSAGRCFVVGVRRKLAKGAQYNPFSLAFAMACELCDILPETMLDACVVCINSDEVEAFLEQLDTAYLNVQEGHM